MWTDPTGHVYVTGEIVTAATLNTYVKDNLAWLADPHRCRVYNTAAISIPNNATTAVAFNAERYNVGSMHSTVTNTSRVTVQTGGAGKYVCIGNVEWAANGAGIRLVMLRINGTVSINEADQPPASATNLTEQQAVGEYAFAVGDYVEMVGYQNSGAALNITASGNVSPELSVSWRSI